MAWPALGWRGSNQHWHRYMAVYLILAGISTPLVLSVHSTISFDFAFSQNPGWHTTIFPPYFVAGALVGGFAMVLILAIPMREIYGLKDLITMRHLENCAKILIATSLLVVYGYAMEAWSAYYSGSIDERFMAWNRAFGPYGWSYWALLACNLGSPQLLWFRKIRTNLIWLFVISVILSIGMWLERWVIIVVPMTREMMPSAWHGFTPTGWDWAQYIGTFGLFLTCFLLFCRILPVIAMAEMRELVHHELHHSHSHDGAELSPDFPAPTKPSLRRALKGISRWQLKSNGPAPTVKALLVLRLSTIRGATSARRKLIAPNASTPCGASRRSSTKPNRS